MTIKFSGDCSLQGTCELYFLFCSFKQTIMTYILIKYLHFIGIFLVVGSLFAETWMISSSLTRSRIRTLSRVDGIYGMAAMITVAAGLILWLSDIGKPPEFYQNTGLVYLKLGIFIVVGLLSIYPTVFFVKNRQSKKNTDGSELITVPRLVKTIIVVELLLVFTLPFFASLMAQGLSIF